MRAKFDHSIIKHLDYLLQEPTKTADEFVEVVKSHAIFRPRTPGKRTPTEWEEVIYLQSDEEKVEKP